MKALQKKLLIAVLSLSNLAVLGMVFHVYFDSSQSLYLFSSSEDSDQLKDKIKKECKNKLQKLADGKRDYAICAVRVKRRQKGASYILKTRVEVTRQKDGSIKFDAEGRMMDKTQHATEADFCGTCLESPDIQKDEVEFKDIMEKVIDIAEKNYSKAEDSVNKAQREHNKKDRERRMARLKERRCLGKWNREDEVFEDFDIEEKLSCKINRAEEFNLPLEVEDYYHNSLKRELWKVALSDDDYYILNDKLLDPLSASPLLSVRASTGLLRNYLNWREDFGILEGDRERLRFLRGIQDDIYQTTNLMKKEHSTADLLYLNRGFDNLLVQLDKSTSALPSLHNTPPSNPNPSIDYEAVRKGTQHLY